MGDGTRSGTEAADLAALLAGAVRAVVEAQDVLDERAREEAARFAAAPVGSLALPPLWFAFDSVDIDVELSSEIVRTAPPSGGPDTVRLLCRTLNPVTASLFGHSASAGTRIHVALVRQRLAPLVSREEVPPSRT